MIDRLTEVIATCDDENIYGTASALIKIRDELEKSGEIKNPDALDYFAKTKLESLMTTKLGQYEDVEQSLKFSLKILGKLLLQTDVYIRDKGYCQFIIAGQSIIIWDKISQTGIGFDRYGIDWALTKEELLNEQSKKDQ